MRVSEYEHYSVHISIREQQETHKTSKNGYNKIGKAL